MRDKLPPEQKCPSFGGNNSYATRFAWGFGCFKKKRTDYIIPPEVYRNFSGQLPSKEEIISFVEELSRGTIQAKSISTPVVDTKSVVSQVKEITSVNKQQEQISQVKNLENNEILKVKSSSLFSLANTLRPKQQSHASEQSAVSMLCEKFSIDQLEYHWLAYAQRAQIRGHQGLFVAMKSADLKLAEDSWVEIAVGSNSMAKEIEDMAFDLFEFLKKELKNQHIRHSIVVCKTEKELLPYTQREIFDYLQAKNPKLSLIADKLKIHIS